MKGPFIFVGFFLITCSLGAQTNKWDAGHETISRYVTEAGDRVDEFLTDVFDIKDDPRSETFDRFYGDRRVEEEAKITRLKISPRVEFKDAQPAEFDVKFSIKLKLPRLKDRVQLIVDNLREDEEILDELQTKVNSNQDILTEGDSSASVRVLLKETMNFRATFDTGLKFDPEPIPRVKLRLRAHRPLKHWTPRFTQSFFWESDDGFGEKTQFDLERERSNRYLLRLTTSALWSETSRGVEVAEILSYYYFISNRRAIGFRTGVIGHVEPHDRIDTYFVRIPFRQKIYKNWIFLEIEPGLDFPIERDYETTPLIQIKFDFMFGKLSEENESTK